ncbi:MAG: FtsX-like permease family protein [Gammaproteobacteria bacterium]|nr:FtsX-like permease family protein [Gammaproteobacteria bacterium]
MLLLIKGQLRYLARTAGATAASVVATALGTMSVVAVHLLSEDIKAGLDHEGALPIPGYTHVVRGTDIAWDDYFDARDRWRQGQVTGAAAMTPVILGQARVGDRSAQVVGVDLVADGRSLAPETTNADSAGEDWTRMLVGDGVVVGDSPGFAAGDTVRAGDLEVNVVAVAANGPDVVFADIPTALGILGRTGPSAILVRARGGEPAIERWFPGSTAAFDMGVAIELGEGLTAQPLDEAEPTRRFALAILFNLGALGVLALFVAAFLVYQASYSNIARRERERERLTAMGVDSGTMRSLFVTEGALIGLAGALIGTLLGLALASFLSSTASFAPSAVAVTKGILGGVGAGFMGAFAAMRRATERRRAAGPRWIAAGFVVALVAVVAVSDALAAAFGLILALCVAQFALLMPGIAAALQRAFESHMDRVNLLARANLRRLGTLLGEVDMAASALSIALAAAIGMGVQIENFREDFYRMLDQRLWRALYIESEDPVDAQWLASLPGVKDVRSYGGAEALLNGRPVTVTLGVGDALESRRYGYGAALEGDILLSESGALAHGLAAGDSIEIEGPRGVRQVRVAHVFTDYGAPAPRVIGTFAVLASAFDGIAFDRTSVLVGDTDTGALKRAIGERYPGAHVRDQSELRALAEEAFDRTFEVAGHLTFIALLVAVAGLYNALSAIALRARDVHGLLYASGVSRLSIAGLAMQQNLLLGVVAAVAAVPLGLAIAYVLCTEVNPRAFGWSIPFGIDVAALLTPTLLGVAAAALAGVVPVWRGVRTLDGAPQHALL